VKDLEALSYCARGQLRQLVRIRWLAIVILAALVYSMHGALDIHAHFAILLALAALGADRIAPVSAARGDQGRRR
jgi:hypothetical protein